MCILEQYQTPQWSHVIRSNWLLLVNTVETIVEKSTIWGKVVISVVMVNMTQLGLFMGEAPV